MTAAASKEAWKPGDPVTPGPWWINLGDGKAPFAMVVVRSEPRYVEGYRLSLSGAVENADYSWHCVAGPASWSDVDSFWPAELRGQARPEVEQEQRTSQDVETFEARIAIAVGDDGSWNSAGHGFINICYGREPSDGEKMSSAICGISDDAGLYDMYFGVLRVPKYRRPPEIKGEVCNGWRQPCGG